MQAALFEVIISKISIKFNLTMKIDIIIMMVVEF